MKVVILGAGAAGSTAWHVLKRLGAEAKVFERADALTAAGAGITLAPNGLHVLSQLDDGALLRKINAVSTPNKTVSAYNMDGKRIGGTDFSGVPRRFGYPLLGLARHDLQTSLIEGMRPGVDVHFGKSAVRVDDVPGSTAGSAGRPGAHHVAHGEQKAVVHFSDGSSEEADVVIAADGARSATSAYVTGSVGSDTLRPTGFTCTYGLTAKGSYPLSDRGEVTWIYGKGRCWGAWCVPDGRAFWFTVHRHGELEGETGPPSGGAWAASNTALPAVTKAFSGLFHPVQGGFDHILATTERAAVFGLADRSGNAFAKGRVALAGDAARTVTPWGGQGANQAIEDAAELGNALAPLARMSSPSRQAIEHALRGYESKRTARSAAVASFSRQTGHVQMLPGLLGDGVRRLALNGPAWMTEMSLGWLYGHRITLASA